MATINTINNEINIKIVYYGPGLSGKTTNLRYIYQNVPQNLVSEMISLDTPEERTNIL
jgi:GTPase SAR1 family protein